MLINFRNAMMAGKRLPYDAEVEYLESTGTQYINTGVILDSTYGIDILFAPMESASGVSEHGVFGSSVSGSGSVHNVLQIHSSAGGVGLWMPSNTRVASAAITVGTIQRWQINVDNSDDIIIDGVDKGNTHPTTASACPYPVYLFARDVGGAIKSGSFSEMRLYSWTVTDASGNVIQQLIPVRKGTVGYMYDRVSGKLFGNAGTGDFQYGQDVVPVEYIESTGTQYIDTKVAFSQRSDDTYIEMLMSYTSGTGAEGSNGQDRYFFVGRTAPTKLYFGCGNWGATDLDWGTNQAATVKLTSSGKAYFNGNPVNITYDGIYGNTNNLYLFAVNPAAYFTYQKKYWCKIYVSGVLVRDYIPVRVGSGSSFEGAMLDTVERKVYRKVGTGALLYGNDV